MRRLRVLHIITRLDRGGSAENTLLTAAGMAGDFDVELAVGPTAGPESPTAREARERGVRFVHQPHLICAPHPLRDLLALRHLRRLIAAGGYDVVHTHTSKAGLLGRLAADSAGVPAIVHTPHGHVFYGYYGRLRTALFIALERYAARRCHRLIALTTADRDDHLRFGVGLPTQWEIVHSGVDFSELDRKRLTPAQIRSQLELSSTDFVIATLGRLTGVKGQADLVRAFATLTASGGPTRLLLIGDGEELQPLQRLCAELGVAERVVFSGWREDVGDVLRAVDLFVLPSLNEGMGKALVEAMYIGLPLVATRVGGVPDLVVDGRHGLLVPPGQPEALGQALTRLWKDAALRDRLGEQACQRAARFGSEAMVQKLCRLYRSLSGGQPPDPRDDGHQPVEENAVACP